MGLTPEQMGELSDKDKEMMGIKVEAVEKDNGQDGPQPEAAVEESREKPSSQFERSAANRVLGILEQFPFAKIPVPELQGGSPHMDVGWAMHMYKQWSMEILNQLRAATESRNVEQALRLQRQDMMLRDLQEAVQDFDGYNSRARESFPDFVNSLKALAEKS